MDKIPLDEALTALGRADPSFNEEVRALLRPVWDRFFSPPSDGSNRPNDGLHTPPPWLAEPDLREVAMRLAELALKRGIDVNLACETNGNTFLHEIVLIRDAALSLESAKWLLNHGADPNLNNNEGQTPFTLAVKLGRSELIVLMQAHVNRRS